MARVLRTNRARIDLLAIWSYIAEDSLDSADAVLDEIDQCCRRLAEFPEMGRVRDELGAAVRSFPVRSYIIYYRPSSKRAGVLRVLHGARDIRAID